ncbi:MAG: hypothetical protein K9H64_23595 [Bacteroidales bacterium]|nr:hypothetical protein [Bacteroidales bacterium]MCF8459029.1 hypothetical protein [Bacteroidales bacterium]
MTLQEANNFFESLKNETTTKSEIRIYEKFLHIITQLKSRAFTKEELQTIEAELDSLKLNSNPENKKKYFKKALSKFESYLKDAFSFTSKWYYTILGIVFGPAFGVLLGVLIGGYFERSLGVSFGISIGLLIGMLVGGYMDARVKAAGNML